ncbi:MAG: hypothetical protein V1743_05715 [Nanoarchaeota archaeon]
MEVDLPDDVSEEVDRVSDVLGIDKKAFVDRAILVYLDNVKKMVDLKKEMSDWDALSDEALENFEKGL